ncbi:MAG: hypothetical protein P1U89_01575 [Verrucomicrobiales bacterium]|nr:hypothetical protein [Verrucomicrobiales bacterium]
MNGLKLTCLLFILPGMLKAADLKVFTEPRAAITAARTEGKLIVFLLWDSRDKTHLPVAEKLKVDLNRLNDEFVLVNCAHSQKANRDLFSGRFGKELTALPIAVVSNDAGEAITSTNGTEAIEYDKLLLTARIEGGKISDPVKLATLKTALEKVGEEKGFLTPMVEDLKQEKVAITKMRQWTKTDGSTFDAILLEALGDHGVFVDQRGNSTKVKFMELSPEDLKLLQSLLRVE